MSYEQIAEKIGRYDQIHLCVRTSLIRISNRSEVYVAALFFAQAVPDEKDLKGLSETLDIPLSTLTDQLGVGYTPQRGLGPMPPQDPLLYRLYEVVCVYGQPLKQVIHEKFGDGISRYSLVHEIAINNASK